MVSGIRCNTAHNVFSTLKGSKVYGGKFAINFYDPVGVVGCSFFWFSINLQPLWGWLLRLAVDALTLKPINKSTNPLIHK